MSLFKRNPPPPQCWQLEIAKGITVPIDRACIGIGQDLAPADLINLALGSGFQQICQKNGHLYEDELKACESLVQAGDAFRQFPVSCILHPQQLNQKSERKHILIEEHFNSTEQKTGLFDKVMNVMVDLGIVRTIVDDVNAVTDELFTNALYNAPFIDPNVKLNPGISRQNIDVRLENGKYGRLFMARHESRLIIGCEDPYGSLDLRMYLNKIKRTYEHGPADTMNFGSGGAGIGSYIIFNAGSSLYFGVWPGQSTILCCVVALGMSNKVRTKLPKHLHWFQR